MTAQELVKDAIKKAFNTLKKKSAIYSNGEVIPAGANLNSYTTVGVYYSPNGARSETISNTPVTNSGYKLIVTQAGYTGTSYMVQIAIIGSASSQTIYMRNRTTSAWNAWICLTQGDMRSAFIYAPTYAELYSLCTSMQTSRSSTFSLAAAAAKAISNDKIDGTFKGIVNKVNDTTFDFFGTALAGGMFYAIRATLAASGATIAYLYRTVMPSTSSPLVKRISYTYAYSSLAAGATLNITAEDFGISVPSGYSQIGISGMYTGNNNVVVRNAVYATGTNTAMSIRNVSSSSASGTAGLGYIYIRSEALNG